MSSHETVLVQAGSCSALIDKDLVPLIRGLWEQGIATLNCCQGERDPDGHHVERPWIMFAPGPNARNFGKLMLCAFPDQKVWGRASARYVAEHFGVDQERWCQWSWSWETTFKERYDDFVITCRFPREDLDTMTKALGGDR